MDDDVVMKDVGMPAAGGAGDALAHRSAAVLQLAKEHAHPNDARVTFVEADHTYFVDGQLMGISVTGLIHTASPDDFDPDEALVKMKRGRNWPNAKYADVVSGRLVPWADDRIKTQWRDAGKLATDLGTDLHGCLELRFNGESPRVIDENTATFAWALAWFDTQAAEGWEPWRTEMLIFDKDASLAGSVDFIARHKTRGTYMIIDWKRCGTDKLKSCFGNKRMRKPLDGLEDTKDNKWRLQVNVYREILETHYGWTIERMCMVVCHPDNTAPCAQVYEYERTDAARVLIQSRKERLVMC